MNQSRLKPLQSSRNVQRHHIISSVFLMVINQNHIAVILPTICVLFVWIMADLDKEMGKHKDLGLTRVKL